MIITNRSVASLLMAFSLNFLICDFNIPKASIDIVGNASKMEFNNGYVPGEKDPLIIDMIFLGAEANIEYAGDLVDARISLLAQSANDTLSRFVKSYTGLEEHNDPSKLPTARISGLIPPVGTSYLVYEASGMVGYKVIMCKTHGTYMLPHIIFGYTRNSMTPQTSGATPLVGSIPTDRFLIEELKHDFAWAGIGITTVSKEGDMSCSGNIDIGVSLYKKSNLFFRRTELGINIIESEVVNSSYPFIIRGSIQVSSKSSSGYSIDIKPFVSVLLIHSSELDSTNVNLQKSFSGLPSMISIGASIGLSS